MTLYLIGLGLNDEKDITLRGLETIKKSDVIYLEQYTSRLSCHVNDIKKHLERQYNKTVIDVKREDLEDKSDLILKEAKTKEVSLLIAGSPLSATTHFDLYLEAKKRKIESHIIENASVINAIGITGLFLYKFGRTTTIPFDNKDIKSPYEDYLKNKEIGLHTLFLLDIKEDKLMTAREGLDYLIRLGLDKETLIIGCAALGSLEPEIKVRKAKDLNLKKFPQCFIIPGKLNFKEEEALNFYKS